jgi:hypothetical protein
MLKESDLPLHPAGNACFSKKIHRKCQSQFDRRAVSVPLERFQTRLGSAMRQKSAPFNTQPRDDILGGSRTHGVYLNPKRR